METLLGPSVLLLKSQLPHAGAIPAEDIRETTPALATIGVASLYMTASDVGSHPSSTTAEQWGAARPRRPTLVSYGMLGQLAGCAWSTRMAALSVPAGKK